MLFGIAPLEIACSSVQNSNALRRHTSADRLFISVQMTCCKNGPPKLHEAQVHYSRLWILYLDRSRELQGISAAEAATQRPLLCKQAAQAVP